MAKSADDLQVKLTYFNIEAAAEKVRLALTMCGKNFEDVRIAFPDWPALKPHTPYGQLPYMELTSGADPNYKAFYAQSGAMMRWAARKFDQTGTLYPADADAVLAIEEMIGLGEDMARSWGPALYMGMGMHTNFGHPEDWPAKAETVKAMREKFLAEQLPKFMGFLKTHLAKNGGNAFLCGPNLTIADLQWLAQLRYYTKGIADHVPKDSLSPYPEVLAWMQRCYDVPQIKAWYQL